METATRTAKKKKKTRQTNKQTQDLISRKINFAGAHFFIHYFALLLHDYNVKPPSYTFCGGNVACVSVPWFFSFSPPLIFTLVAASIPHLLTAAIKFLRFSSSEIRSPLFMISRSSSFWVIHVGEHIKI